MAAGGMLITIALQRAVASISGRGRTRKKKTTVMTTAAMTDLAQLDTSLRGDKRLYQKSVGASTYPGARWMKRTLKCTSSFIPRLLHGFAGPERQCHTPVMEC
jgi:hypothetical protein